MDELVKAREYRTRVQTLLRVARQWREERIALVHAIRAAGSPQEVLSLNMNPLTERAVIDALDVLDD